MEADDKLIHLKELIENGIVSNEVAKKVLYGENIDNENIKEIFSKIDQIESVKNIDDYIPKSLRITKKEYLQSIENEEKRLKTITKLESALKILGQQVNPENAFGIGLFSGFLTVLDKNLILVQENHIDIRNNLKIKNKQKNTLIGSLLQTWKQIFID